MPLIAISGILGYRTVYFYNKKSDMDITTKWKDGSGEGLEDRSEILKYACEKDP